MAGRRRPSIEDREPRIDLFDDPPWDPGSERRRGPLRLLLHVVFVLFLAFLGLLGLAGVLAVALIFIGLHGLGSLNLAPSTPPSHNGLDIALSPEGSVAYVTEPSQNRLLVLDTATSRLITSVAVGANPTGLAVTPNGAQVWVVNTALPSIGPGESSGPGTPSGSAGTSVSVVSTATNQVLGTLPVGSGPIDVAFSPDGREAYITDYGVLVPGAVTVIDTTTLAETTLTPATAPSSPAPDWNPTSVAVTPDGREVWVSGVDATSGSTSKPDHVYVFDATTHAPMAKIAVGTGPYFMVLSRDGREAYVADKVSCDLREIDTVSFQIVATVHWPKSDGCPFGLAAGPNDDIVYTVTGNDHTIDAGTPGNVFGVVDFRTSQVLVHTHVGSDPVIVASSPRGSTAYVVDADLPVIDVVNPISGATTFTIWLPERRDAAASTSTSTLTSMTSESERRRHAG